MLTTTSFYYFKYFLIETHFTSKFRDLNEIKAKFIKRYVTIQSIVTFDLAQSTQNERHGDEDHDGSCFHYLYIIHYHYSEWNRCCRYVGLICLLQTHFARILFQNDLQCSWKSFSKPSRWLIHKCIFMYKCLNDLAPRYVYSMWIFLAAAIFKSLLLKMATIVLTVEFGTIHHNSSLEENSEACLCSSLNR